MGVSFLTAIGQKNKKLQKIDLKRNIWVYLSLWLVRKWNFMAIALVKSQFGPTSTQNLQFSMFWPILAMPGRLWPWRMRSGQPPCSWGIASAYGGASAMPLGCSKWPSWPEMTLSDFFFSSLWPSPFSCPPCLCFSFCLALRLPTVCFAKTLILKKMNKFLFHAYIVFAYVFQKLVFSLILFIHSL